MTTNRIEPLGDQAALAYLADEEAALRFAAAVREINTAWLVDIVQAYSSVAVFFDLMQTNFQDVAARLHPLTGLVSESHALSPGKMHRIPCCYELQLDLERAADQLRLSAEEVIRLHSESEYTVYAIGFCPGFPYLGYLPEALSGLPRLPQPRVRVPVGSVGITGRQTGIYTQPTPGGWHLIGRTPLEMVNVEDGYFPLRTGDHIRFVRIDDKEFARLAGQRLT
jgi:inhibitor of KinA